MNTRRSSSWHGRTYGEQAESTVQADPHVGDLLEVVRHFECAMFITHDRSGRMRARPLMVSRCDPNGWLWFLVRRDSMILSEIADDSRVNVVFQSAAHYASISGVASTVEDAVPAELWHERFLPWFPQGPEDPGALVVSVKPLAAEYWKFDSSRGGAGWARSLAANLFGARDQIANHRKLGRARLHSKPGA